MSDKNNRFWTQKPEHQPDRAAASVTFIDPDGEWQAMVKWDGCVHLSTRLDCDEPSDDDDYIHICDLDEMIERLQNLRELARRHFSPEPWPWGLTKKVFG